MKKTLLTLLCFVVACAASVAQKTNVRMPHFFTNGMVLQRGVKMPVWGWGEAGEKVTVKLLEARTSGAKLVAEAKTTVGQDGRWKAWLPKMGAGGPYRMLVVSRSHAVGIEDVLVGDVFLCSGQSNMELPVRRCMDVVGADVKDYRNNNIRYLKLPHQFNYVRPNDDVQIQPWQDITPENCAEVSAICYFMAKELQEKHGVPVGIVNSSVGGTQVQAWMPQEVLKTFPGYEREFEQRKYTQEDWVDSVRRAETRAGGEWERTMVATDTVVNKWRQRGYDFSAWPTVNMFADWSKPQTTDGVQATGERGLRNGSFWFRTTVTLPAELAGRKGVLRFGAMKDADSIFVNGHCVGNTTYEYPPRVYTVGEGILREGENDIVVHLMSQSGRPNFTKGKLYQLEVGELVFPIEESIQMAVGCMMPPKPSSTYFVDCPTGLYNAMIAPLGDFPFRGMLWYQGESNQGKPEEYAALLEGMVGAWRQQMGRDIPAVIVQLPAYMGKHDQPVETGWTRIRHQQYRAAQNIGNAALVPTLDTGEYNDIHPQEKRAAGRRAAWQINHLVYGDPSTVGGGPVPVSATVKDGVCVITFSPTSGKLKESELHDFAILVGGKYQWAKAAVTGDHTVAVTLPYGTRETTVRYCWDDYPQPSLFNTDGVPAPQFEIATGTAEGASNASEQQRPLLGRTLSSYASTPKFGGYFIGKYAYTDQEGQHGGEGFSQRFIRAYVDGTILDDFKYRVQVQVNNSAMHMKDYFVEWSHWAELAVKAGQYKRAFLLENPYNPWDVGAGDYSQIARQLAGIGDKDGTVANGGRDQGIQLQGDLFPSRRDGHRFLHYQLQMMNGQGINSADANGRKDFIGTLQFQPIRDLSFAVFGWTGNYVAADGTTQDRNRWAASVSYKRSGWVARAEYAHSQGHLHADGWYATVGVPCTPWLTLYTKYDAYRSRKTWGSMKTIYSIVPNVQIHKNLLFQVQYNRVHDRSLASSGCNEVWGEMYVRF